MIKNIFIFSISLFIILYLYLLYLYFILNFNINNIEDNRDIKYNKLKVAVVISGQIRDDYYIPLSSIKNNLIKPLNADVFYNFDDNKTQSEKEKIHNFLSPKKYKWESYDIKKEYNFLTNIFKMTKRIYEANNLKKDYERENNFVYDIVIRIRPDVLLKNKLPSKLINNIKFDTVYAPMVNKLDIIHHMKYFICDQIDLGTSKTMDIFSNFYLDIDKYTKHVLCERMLYFYMKNNKINIEYYEIKFLLYEEVIKIFSMNNNYKFMKKLTLKIYQILMFKFLQNKYFLN